MTASDLAALAHGRRVGKGRWVAKCPAHPDKSPSLSIAEGKRSPTVFRCMSQQCKPEAILAALGISWRDVLGDRPTNPKAIREAQERRKREAQVERREKIRARSLFDQCRYWELRYYELAKQLAMKDSANTARLFHEALDRFRTLEAQVEPILHPKRT